MFFCLIALENIKSVNHMFGLKKTNAVGFAVSDEAINKNYVEGHNGSVYKAAVIGVQEIHFGLISFPIFQVKCSSSGSYPRMGHSNKMIQYFLHSLHNFKSRCYFSKH